MRWYFPDKSNAAECSRRQKTLSAMDEWWAAFSERQSDISRVFEGRSNLDLPSWMREHLHAIDDRLMWEFGPAVRGGGHRLVITPETEHHLRPMVRALLKRRPALPGWEFYDHRIAESPENAIATVEARVQVSAAGSTLRIERGKHSRIDLHFMVPDAASDHRASQAGFVLAEALLGEDVLNDWVGEIHSKCRTGWFSKRSNGVPLNRVKETFRALQSSICDQLPNQPWFELVNDETSATVLRAQPRKGLDDYPDQQDLWIANTVVPEVMSAALADPLFSSQRFSRVKETFCYVKIDAASIARDAALTLRRRIEEQLDSMLRTQRMGIAVGGAMGLRYIYVELALVELNRSIASIRGLLAPQWSNKRAWLMFHDAALKGEWIALGDPQLTPPGLPS